MSPPITLNKVDLPQPEGPITARNSPGATSNDTRSIAVSAPSGVSKRLTMSSTRRIGPAGFMRGAAMRGLSRSFRRTRERGGHRRRVPGLDPYVDDRHGAVRDRRE